MNEQPNVTLRQIYPLFGINQDTTMIRLVLDSKHHTTYLDVILKEIPKLLSDNILDGRVSLIEFNSAMGKIQLTVKVKEDGKEEKRNGCAPEPQCND